ncbi:MAG: hypothetical protein RLY57_631 [Candidatus Parcubacteria bacterium]
MLKFIITLMAMVSIAFAQTTATPSTDLKDRLTTLDEDVEIFSGEVLTVKRMLTAWLKNNNGKVIITGRLQSGGPEGLVITVFYQRIPEPKAKVPVDPKEKK